MSTGIWPADKVMTVPDAILVSLTGMATVFMALIALALCIIVTGKVLDAMGIGVNSANKSKQTANAVASSTSTNSTKAVAPVQENTEEIAVILAAVSEHTRTPIEQLKINSITKK